MLKLRMEDSESEGVSLAQAYEELPRWAFAQWIRLMAEPTVVLKNTSMNEWAVRLRCSSVWVYSLFRVLKRTGYVRVITKPNGRKQFFFAKRPMLVSPNQFVKF
jgi:hypothetical protein